MAVSHHVVPELGPLEEQPVLFYLSLGQAHVCFL